MKMARVAPGGKSGQCAGMIAKWLVLLLAGATHLPKDAGIVDVDADDPLGDVLVTFDDGHREKWTLHGGCADPHVSDKGLVGWQRIHEGHGLEDPYGASLRVCWPEGHNKDYAPDYRYIDGWDFAPDGKALVIECGFAHGPRYFQEIDLATGQTIAEVKGPDVPDWAVQAGFSGPGSGPAGG